MTQTSGPVHTGYSYFNLLFTICQVFFNKKFIFFDRRKNNTQIFINYIANKDTSCLSIPNNQLS